MEAPGKRTLHLVLCDTAPEPSCAKCPAQTCDTKVLRHKRKRRGKLVNKIVQLNGRCKDDTNSAGDRNPMSGNKMEASHLRSLVASARQQVPKNKTGNTPRTMPPSSKFGSFHSRLLSAPASHGHPQPSPSHSHSGPCADAKDVLEATPSLDHRACLLMEDLEAEGVDNVYPLMSDA